MKLSTLEKSQINDLLNRRLEKISSSKYQLSFNTLNISEREIVYSLNIKVNDLELSENIYSRYRDTLKKLSDNNTKEKFISDLSEIYHLQIFETLPKLIDNNLLYEIETILENHKLKDIRNMISNVIHDKKHSIINFDKVINQLISKCQLDNNDNYMSQLILKYQSRPIDLSVYDYEELKRKDFSKSIEKNVEYGLYTQSVAQLLEQLFDEHDLFKEILTYSIDVYCDNTLDQTYHMDIKVNFKHSVCIDLIRELKYKYLINILNHFDYDKDNVTYSESIDFDFIFHSASTIK